MLTAIGVGVNLVHRHRNSCHRNSEEECTEKEQTRQHGGRVSQVRACRKAEFDPFLF